MLKIDINPTEGKIMTKIYFCNKPFISEKHETCEMFEASLLQYSSRYVFAPMFKQDIKKREVKTLKQTKTWQVSLMSVSISIT